MEAKSKDLKETHGVAIIVQFSMRSPTPMPLAPLAYFTRTEGSRKAEVCSQIMNDPFAAWTLGSSDRWKKMTVERRKKRRQLCVIQIAFNSANHIKTNSSAQCKECY